MYLYVSYIHNNSISVACIRILVNIFHSASLNRHEVKLRSRPGLYLGVLVGRIEIALAKYDVERTSILEGELENHITKVQYKVDENIDTL